MTAPSRADALHAAAFALLAASLPDALLRSPLAVAALLVVALLAAAASRRSGVTAKPSAPAAAAAACPPAAASSPCCGSAGAGEACCQSAPPAPDALAACRVYFGSAGGTAERFARQLADRAAALGAPLAVLDMRTAEPEAVASASCAVFVVSTYDGGAPPAGCEWFCRSLAEAAVDERVGGAHLACTRVAVFGCANSAYGDEAFNRAARDLDASLSALGAPRMAPVGCADEDSAEHVAVQFERWMAALLPRLQPEYSDGDESSEDESGGSEVVAGSEDDLDMEDIGGSAVPRTRKAAAADAGEKKEMVTPKVRASLVKQGYRVLGSHSGVKLCRWTKSQLRGRGGCYKNALYGIESHRCMEATPSLACANKCRFCWRQHTNPVGKEWKWAMDPPEQIVEAALAAHGDMVKQMRGVPGVLPERLAEGMQPRHCALSLVGEPIMYPEINSLVGMLHARRISTFLVTNAQFPDAIRNLVPVTQLYVSVDASNKEALKAIDRPLFADYWERFTACLRALRDKQQRTVYRLTLVAGYNMSDAAEYATLVELGQPDFIELKGMTYCGGGGDLTMANVPYHADVLRFASALADAVSARGGVQYSLACEYEHSCCTLLARQDRYLRDGRWHTHIAYERFHDLVAAGKPFTAADYCAPTPDWALAGSAEAGFNPSQTRFKKIRNHPGKETAAAAGEDS